MDFLTLVKRLATETGTELEAKIDSVDIPPAAGYGSTTEHRTRLINWIQTAWQEIQEDQDQWDFMVGRTQVDIAEGIVEVPIGVLVDLKEGETIYDTLVPFVAQYDYRYIWLVDNSTSPPVKNKCYYVIPEQFFGETDRYNTQCSGTPTRFSINRKNCIVFDCATGHANFALQIEFKMLPTAMSGNTSTPRGLPEKHHMLIVYKAMTYYAGFDETGPQFQRAAKLYRDKMNKLRQNELREYSIPGDRS
jgi:hypothetical protein